MERAEYTNLNRAKLYSSFVILFHVVGLVGFLIPSLNGLFLKLVPWHLLLMLVLLIACQEEKKRVFWYCLPLFFVLGFLVEMVGVKTGLIFGRYQYGATLGIKYNGIPLLIGVNWLLLIISSAAFLEKFKLKIDLVIALIGAALLTILDVFIEPVAVKFDYWNWADNRIPFQNSLGWFLVSFCMLWLYLNLNFKKTNGAASIFFVVQILFFLILYACV